MTETDDQEGFIGEGIKDHVFVAQTTAGLARAYLLETKTDDTAQKRNISN